MSCRFFNRKFIRFSYKKKKKRLLSTSERFFPMPPRMRCSGCRHNVTILTSSGPFLKTLMTSLMTSRGRVKKVLSFVITAKYRVCSARLCRSTYYNHFCRFHFCKYSSFDCDSTDHELLRNLKVVYSDERIVQRW